MADETLVNVPVTDRVRNLSVVFTIAPPMYMKYQNECKTIIENFLAQPHDRSEYKTKLTNFKMYVSDRTLVKIEATILEIVKNKPTKRVFIYSVDYKGYLEWPPGNEGQSLLWTPLKEWVIFVREINYDVIQKRYSQYNTI